MFADDDAYVNVPSLWSELANNGTINGSSYEVEKCFKFNKNGLDKFLLAQIWGRKFSGNVARPPEGFAQKYLEKSICPRYMFNGEAYPPYLSGAGLFFILQNPTCIINFVFLKVSSSPAPLGPVCTLSPSSCPFSTWRMSYWLASLRRGAGCGGQTRTRSTRWDTGWGRERNTFLDTLWNSI